MFSNNSLLANGYVGCNVTTANAIWYKVLLLAEDKKIKDPTILEQIL
jgi:hypothetical protein